MRAPIKRQGNGVIRIDALDWRSCAKLACLLGLLALFAYLPALGYGFFVDDDVYLGGRNKMLPSLAFADLPRLLFERGNEWEFLPVRDLSYWIDLQLSDGFPDIPHASNLIGYVFCCFAAYLFLRQLLLLYRPEHAQSVTAIAAIGAVLFLLHPAHVEPVVWISGRKDILAGAFTLLGGAAFVNAIRAGWSGRRLAAALLCFLFAVFSKSVAVFALIAIAPIALDARRWQPSANAGKPYLFFLAPLLLSFAALYVHVRVGGATGIGLESALALGDVVERASRILTSLLGIAVFPVKLRLVYDVYALPPWHWLITGMALLAALVAAGLLVLGKRSLAACGVLLFLLPLLPYLQIQPYVTWSMASERFVFQASFGLVLLACLALQRLRPSLVMIVVGAAAVLSLLIVVPRVDDWENSRRLREHDVALSGTHHTTVREFVIGNLLPERRFAESRRLANGIANDGAREKMLALIGVAEFYRAREGRLRGSDLSDYCRLAVPLNRSLLEQQRHAKNIADLTLVNYAGHLRAYLNNALTDVSRACP